MLCFDPEKRSSAVEALNSSWVLNNTRKHNNQTALSPFVAQLLLQYGTAHQLKVNIAKFVSTQLLWRRMEKNLRKQLRGEKGPLVEQEVLVNAVERDSKNPFFAQFEMDGIF